MQYGNWPDLPSTYGGTNNTTGFASNYTYPQNWSGTPTDNSQEFEYYTYPDNPGELGNSFALEFASANNYYAALTSSVNAELYGIPAQVPPRTALPSNNTGITSIISRAAHRRAKQLWVAMMRCCFSLLAASALFASWALAATGPAPDFYARREYGGTRGCSANGSASPRPIVAQSNV